MTQKIQSNKFGVLPSKRYTSKIHTAENWDTTIEALHSGCIVEVDGAVFEYFFGILPPVKVPATEIIFPERAQKFGFAEGREPITVFWSNNDDTRFFAKRTNVINTR